jgi:mono/diheme cytochrome c family protein
MSEEQSISTPNPSVEDADLVSLNDKKSLGVPQVIGYFAIVISVAIAGLYLSKYSGGFDSNQYLESPGIADEIAALGGGSGGEGGAAVEVAFDPIKEGKKIYQTNCMACHQVTGLGLPGAFPPLANSDWVGKDPALLSRIVLYGMQGPITVNGTQFNSIMAPLGAILNDEQISYVLSYVRQEWGNAYDAVDPAVVGAARSETGGHGMWTVEELQPWMGE